MTAGPDTVWMRDAFLLVQQLLEGQLNLASQSIGHSGTQGSVTESHWIDMLRAYLPKRYDVASGFVIDSLGGRSQQIDVVVFDRHFTPTLLDQQSHRYIPAEAVYAVFEAKPHIDKSYLQYAGEKAASVRVLTRTSVPISHAGGQFPAKALFPIVSGILAAKASWVDGLGVSFQANLVRTGSEGIDCGCALDSGAFDSFDGPLRIVPAAGALVHFLFRLLNKLQGLGTVPAIDWAAYAKILQP